MRAFTLDLYTPFNILMVETGLGIAHTEDNDSDGGQFGHHFTTVGLT